MYTWSIRLYVCLIVWHRGHYDPFKEFNFNLLGSGVTVRTPFLHGHGKWMRPRDLLKFMIFKRRT